MATFLEWSSSLTRNQTHACPLHWEHRVLTSYHQGSALQAALNKTSFSSGKGGQESMLKMKDYGINKAQIWSFQEKKKQKTIQNYS